MVRGIKPDEPATPGSTGPPRPGIRRGAAASRGGGPPSPPPRAGSAPAPRGGRRPGLRGRGPPRDRLEGLGGRRLVHHAVARVAVPPAPAREDEGLGLRPGAPRLDQSLDRLLVLGDAVRRVLEGRMDEHGALGGDVGIRLGIRQVAHDGRDLVLLEPARLRLGPGEAPDAMPCPPERRRDARPDVPGGTRDEHLHWGSSSGGMRLRQRRYERHGSAYGPWGAAALYTGWISHSARSEELQRACWRACEAPPPVGCS